MKEVKHQVIIVGEPSIDNISKDALKTFSTTLLNEILKFYNEDKKAGKFPGG